MKWTRQAHKRRKLKWSRLSAFILTLTSGAALFGVAPSLAQDGLHGEVAADQDIVQPQQSAVPSFVLTQPKPLIRPTEYIRPSLSLLATPFAWGSGIGLYGGYGTWAGFNVIPMSSGLIGIPGAPSSGWGGPPYGLNYGYGGPFIAGLGYGGSLYGGLRSGYGPVGALAPFAVNSFFGHGIGYGGWNRGGWAYGNPWFGGFGSGFGLLGGGSQFSPYGDGWGGGMASRVVQEEPSKASGNYYAPSTVDTTASGSYYAQTDGSTIQVPMKQPQTDSSYWGKNSSSSSYWGGSGNPFPKDLNSVPWNK
jgi:hypothetical protein